MMSEHMCRNSILPRSAGLSLRFQVTGYMQLVHCRCRTELPVSSFGLIFPLFPRKVAAANPQPSALSDNPADLGTASEWMK